MQPLFFDLILDITSEFVFEDSLDSLSPNPSDEKRNFTADLRNAKRIMARDGFLGPASAFLSHRDFYRSCAEVHRFCERKIGLVLRRKASSIGSQTSEKDRNTKGYNLLEGLAENSTNMEDLRDGVLTVMIAGVDSVANVLSTVFFLLARHDRIFQKLRSSILDSVGHQPPTFDQLKNLTYLR